ncbi:hypothetical protein O181_036162 [Austropuccinia psidii MF-1]|uniref:Uncharacterized protein n=1 Tax=Austropuccinia psidii MF-1 TaxID=1389203 RepID=A0A9Q3D6K8_9BASI|nr:hypothetical protein [Austropuccinia psidii MF-1]
MTNCTIIKLEGESAHHPSGPQHYISSMRVWMFVCFMELLRCPDECIVQAPATAPAHTNATAPAPAASCSTCITLNA